MWYYLTDGVQSEPVDDNTIRQLIKDGTLLSTTNVWKEGMTDWLPLGKTQLSAFLQPTPQISPAPAPTRVAPARLAPTQAAPAQVYNPYQPPRTTQTKAASSYPAAAPMTWSEILWSFEGRIPRRQYWAGSFLWMVVYLLSMLLSYWLMSAGGDIPGIITMIPFMAVAIAFTWSSLALHVKRWHDRGKSGFMIFIVLIPIIGGIWAFIEIGCLRGTDGPNQYGNDPT